MIRKSPICFLILALITLTLFFFVYKSQKSEVASISRQWLSMGTIAVYDSYSKENVDEEAKIVRAAFDEVSKELSVFSQSSALSRLNQEGVLVIPAAASSNTNLLKVLTFALEVARSTDGAFDPTINPLMRLWGFRKDTREAVMPSDDALRAALNCVGFRHISISTNSNSSVTIKLLHPGVELDLGGIAKGYAVDLAYERLVKAGATNFLLNLGGNIRVCGVPSKNRTSWSIAIRDPASPDRTTGEIIELHSGEAVATSGSYERYVVIDGKQYSHIIDPRTGLPVERTDSVTVIAPSAILADALSTARFVDGEGAIRISSDSN